MPRKSNPVQAPKAPSEPDDVFSRARRLIHGQRQQDYGDKLENFSQIAAFWNATLARKLSEQITPADVPLLMIGMKLARLSKSPTHYDSVLDVAGYAGCLEKMLEEEAFGRPLPGILDEITASSFDHGDGRSMTDASFEVNHTKGGVR
jgi:Domain of unknown function (DUF6378)